MKYKAGGSRCARWCRHGRARSRCDACKARPKKYNMQNCNPCHCPSAHVRSSVRQQREPRPLEQIGRAVARATLSKVESSSTGESTHRRARVTYGFVSKSSSVPPGPQQCVSGSSTAAAPRTACLLLSLVRLFSRRALSADPRVRGEEPSQPIVDPTPAPSRGLLRPHHGMLRCPLSAPSISSFKAISKSSQLPPQMRVRVSAGVAREVYTCAAGTREATTRWRRCRATKAGRPHEPGGSKPVRVEKAVPDGHVEGIEWVFEDKVGVEQVRLSEQRLEPGLAWISHHEKVHPGSRDEAVQLERVGFEALQRGKPQQRRRSAPQPAERFSQPGSSRGGGGGGGGGSGEVGRMLTCIPELSSPGDSCPAMADKLFPATQHPVSIGRHTRATTPRGAAATPGVRARRGTDVRAKARRGGQCCTGGTTRHETRHRIPPTRGRWMPA